MTTKEAISYIENYTWSTTRLGLDRTRELLSALGDPQKKLRFVHVAGSNGKGSTCAMLAAILQEAGYKTGLYTSPYIETFEERMRVNGENIPGERLASITERVRVLADQMEDHPSQFELVTAIAMQYFLEAECDIVVLEVGMGGALDSTNAIDAPEVAVITNIGLEHTEYLGNTLEEIAATKGGIIKEGTRVVEYDGAPEVKETIEKICDEKHVPLIVSDFSQLTPLCQDLNGQSFRYRGKEWQVALLGPHQLCNAAVALDTVEALREEGWEISDEHISAGLAHVLWPARLEVLNKEPLFVLDGGHNPQCAEALANALETLLQKGQKAVFLAGVLADKDYDKMVDLVAPYATSFVCLTPFSDRALSAEDFAAFLQEKGIPAVACTTVEEGLKTAMDQAGEDGAIVSFGSLYLAGAVRSGYRPTYRKWLRTRKIHARDALSPEEREEKSKKIIENILALPEFENAKTVMIYNSVRGEVQLERIEKYAEKRYGYPLCTSKTEMEVYMPSGEDSWAPGSFGILEPIPEKCTRIPPEELDLVLCPLTAFDAECNRCGMGGGFYDRYLPKCKNAKIIGVAFEAQKAAHVPVDAWDRPMEKIVTEETVYSSKA